MLLGACVGGGAVWTYLDGGQRGLAEPLPLLDKGTSKQPSSRVAQSVKAGDPSVKLNQILRANDFQHKSLDLQKLGQEVAEHGISKALAMGKELTGAQDKQDFLKGVMEAWAKQDPAAVAAYAKSELPPGQGKSNAVVAALTEWGRKNPRDAYSWAEKNLDGSVKQEGLYALAQGWAGKAPREAARWYEETGFTDQPLLTALTSTWASAAPRDAANWASNLPEAINRRTGLVAVASEWVKSSPTEATDHFTPIINQGTSGADAQAQATSVDLATALTNIYASENPAAASQWIEKLTSGPARDEAASTLASIWAAKDIQGVIGWSQTLDSTLQGSVINRVAKTWGATQPDRALDWIATLPQNQQGSALTETYSSWAGTDPEGLRNWIDSSSTGLHTDTARIQLGDVLSEDQPMQALDQSLQLTAPQLQTETTARYFNNWQRRDAASAQEWLDSEWSRLPASLQTRLVK